jgi:hypothetical protein
LPVIAFRCDGAAAIDVFGAPGLVFAVAVLALDAMEEPEVFGFLSAVPVNVELLRSSLEKGFALTEGPVIPLAV